MAGPTSGRVGEINKSSAEGGNKAGGVRFRGGKFKVTTYHDNFVFPAGCFCCFHQQADQEAKALTPECKQSLFKNSFFFKNFFFFL